MMGHEPCSVRCIECRFFEGNKKLQRSRWFSLIDDVDTHSSIRQGKCALYSTWASTAREQECKGRDFRPKEDEIESPEGPLSFFQGLAILYLLLSGAILPVTVAHSWLNETRCEKEHSVYDCEYTAGTWSPANREAE